MPDINIIIDSLSNNRDIIQFLISRKKEEPEIFNDNILSISVMGTFPYCIWSSLSEQKTYTAREDIENDCKLFADNKISVFYDFQNTKLNQNHFYDKYSNLILSLSRENSVYAIVADNELANYLKQNYPEIKLVTSAIKDSGDNYDYSVVYLPDIKPTNIEKQIVYLNSYCDKCYQCIDIESENKLNFEKIISVDCPNIKKTFEETKNNKFFVSNSKIEELLQKGIKNFIISGTQDKYEMIESCLYYLIKPEYQNEVRLKAIKQIKL